MLKKKLQEGKENRHDFIWMNKNLTIEDAGFLWEVSYGGDTPGYTVDPEHLIDEIYEVATQGLSATDREMDSGFQVHVSFPFMRGEDFSNIEKVFAFMVHLDDYITLRSYDRAVIDDCNNMWLQGDLELILDAASKSPKDLASVVSPSGSSDKPMPNPRV